MKKIAAIFVAFCLIVVPGMSFSQSANQPLSQQEDVDLSSPEATWNEFRKALIEGNYDLARKCFCPEESNKVNKYKKLGAVKTNMILQSMKSIEKVYQDEEGAKFILHRDLNGTNLTTYISFAKIDNQWKIDKY